MDKSQEALFVLRRAFLVGRCRRTDIDRAFDSNSSPNRGTNILKRAVAMWPRLLYQSGKRGVFPIPDAPVPPEAAAPMILNLIAKNATSKETGIFPNDGAPFLLPQPKPGHAVYDAATNVVLHAALAKRPIRILYVGLRRNESARWRRVWPRALEFTGFQWRIHAQDMDDVSHGFPIKCYVLARVFEAQFLDVQEIPLGFRPLEQTQRQCTLRAHLSEDLTPDQVKAVVNEFGIRDGIMQWPAYAVHDFRRLFSRAQTSDDIIWPLLSRVDALD